MTVRWAAGVVLLAGCSAPAAVVAPTTVPRRDADCQPLAEAVHAAQGLPGWGLWNGGLALAGIEVRFTGCQLFLGDADVGAALVHAPVPAAELFAGSSGEKVDDLGDGAVVTAEGLVVLVGDRLLVVRRTDSGDQADSLDTLRAIAELAVDTLD